MGPCRRAREADLVGALMWSKAMGRGGRIHSFIGSRWWPDGVAAGTEAPIAWHGGPEAQGWDPRARRAWRAGRRGAAAEFVPPTARWAAGDGSVMAADSLHPCLTS